MEAKKITVFGVIPEGIQIGLKNSLSLLGAVVLYILTIWIPYINVGTTIAMATIPIALSKGKVISPTFIFDGKYRKYMGEYFTLIGLQAIALVPAFLFMIVPGIIISLGWSLALYIMLDKEVAPGESMIQSNKATYGYKWTIFGISLVLVLGYLILLYIFRLIPVVGVVLIILLVLCYMVAMIGCNTVIYKRLVLDKELDEEIIITETTTDEGKEITVEVTEPEEEKEAPKKRTVKKKETEEEENTEE